MAFQDTVNEVITLAGVNGLSNAIAAGDPNAAKAIDEWNAGQPISDPTWATYLPRIASRYAVNPGELDANRIVEIYNRANKDAEPSAGQQIFEGAVKLGMAYIGGSALAAGLGGAGAAEGAAGTAGAAPTMATVAPTVGTTAGIGKIIEDIPGTKQQWQQGIADIPGTKEQWQGAAGAGAAYYGAQDQQRAIEAAAEQAKRVEPWYETGRSALGAQSELLGLTGTPEQQLASLQFSPGYQFRRSMGEKQLESGLAARGGMGSGKAAVTAQKWGQDFASQEYQNRLNQLAGLSSQGYLAGAGLGSELGTAELLKGQARMSGLTGASESLTGGQISSQTKKPSYSLADLSRLR